MPSTANVTERAQYVNIILIWAMIAGSSPRHKTTIGGTNAYVRRVMSQLMRRKYMRFNPHEAALLNSDFTTKLPKRRKKSLEKPEDNANNGTAALSVTTMSLNSITGPTCALPTALPLLHSPRPFSPPSRSPVPSSRHSPPCWYPWALIQMEHQTQMLPTQLRHSLQPLRLRMLPLRRLLLKVSRVRTSNQQDQFRRLDQFRQLRSR